MPYTRGYATWQDAPSTATPITAAKMQNIEDGLVALDKVVIGTTLTGNTTLTQAMTGTLQPVSSASSVALTVPVLEAGTQIEIARIGAGAVTLTVSGTTLTIPTGATATPRVQGSVISLLWLTTTSVLVGGDLT